MWRHEGQHFRVEVSRHEAGQLCGEPQQIWCIYAYIYPKHRSFERYTPDGDMWDQPAPDVHSYVSLFKTHRKPDGEITSFQIGWDYNHDRDDYYTQLKTKGDAGSVFYDAEKLIEHLQDSPDEQG